MCNGEDQKAAMAMYHNPQYQECVKECYGVPYLPCVTTKCFKNFVDGKLTPKCSQCYGELFSCGLNKCNICRLVGEMVACELCFRKMCREEDMACGLDISLK